jgi:hypothetical protein
MNRCVRWGWRLGLLVGQLELVSCATREPPTRHSPRGALAPDAAVAAPLPVTQALDGEPPLPGADAGWGGLTDPSAPAASGHSHHGAHAHEH